MKPRGLAVADFVTCAGERQRTYFYPWLTLSGFDLDDLTARVATVPISAAPAQTTAISAPQNDEPSILFAGVALPWQDPLVPLQATLETLERRESGYLDLYLYAHPEHSRGVRWLAWVREQALLRPRLRLHKERLRPYAELLAIYRGADLAFDLFARNPERELAFNTRTVDYLACGLPPLYSDYAELAGPIGRYGAGIIVDPTDTAAISQALNAALDDTTSLADRRVAAQQLVDDLLTWDRTVAPLARWCQEPTCRTRDSQALDFAALQPPQNDISTELATAQAAAAHRQAVATEREAYARHVEAAWRERGEALAAHEATDVARQSSPWRSALQQKLGRSSGRGRDGRGE